MFEIQSLLNEPILKKYKSESLGSTYEELCDTFPLQPIQNKSHHEAALRVLSILSESIFIQKPNQKIKKQILKYIEALGILVEEYEHENFSRDVEKISGSQVLEFLMEQHELKQSDLIKEVGSQSIVSEILSGKRKLNNNQIIALSKRFGLSPAAFFPV